MSELAVRLALIASALLVAGVVVLYLRSRGQGRPVEVSDIGFEAGVYLFTSSACQGCRSARRRVREELGESGFTELNWEQSPGEFHRLGVAAVPSTLVVRSDDTGTLFPGQPDEALRSYDPTA